MPPDPVVHIAGLHGDGSLAFISRGSLWLLDTSTYSVHELVPAKDHPDAPQFSADGKWLAFLAHRRGGGTWICLVRSDGGGMHRLHRRDIAFDGWAPRGHRLAIDFVSRRGAVPVRDTSVVATWRPGTEPRAVARVGGLTGVVWSPDGRELGIATADWDRRGSVPGTTSIATYPIAGGRPTIWFSRLGQHGRLEGEDELYLRLAGWWQGQGIGFWLFGNGEVLSPDQAPLELLVAPRSQPRRLGQTLPGGGALAGGRGEAEERTVDASRLGYLADVDQIGRDGFGRQIWFRKRLTVCAPAATCRRVPAPPRTVTLDPAWSPDGKTLAYVIAPSRASVGFPQRIVRRWYAAHRLALYRPSTGRVRYIHGTAGASAPMWSRDGKDLIYAARDGIWLLRVGAARATRVATPLFAPGDLPAYYGQVDWVGQFAWSAGG
jgi:TolB protein